MDKKHLDICGSELIALAGSLAICIAKNYEKEDLRKLRCFFSTISSNLGIIESEGLHRKNKEVIKK
ncbi:MAG: hypothetical protein J6C53_00770 [Clostridia bacterium]|nr:hypothetical protein [Clostridia bacterium]